MQRPQPPGSGWSRENGAVRGVPPQAARGEQSSARPGHTTVEYVVRVPKIKCNAIFRKDVSRSYHAMKFNANLNIDVGQWTKVNMVRENNIKEFKIDDDMPKYGAGSEYGKDARDEARRRKYGRSKKKYSAEDQPWLMKIGGKAGKKFKGLREGGVTENASYYVFMQGNDGSFEAYPIKHWYNFTPIQRFKALTAEEAEVEFGRRNKIMNFFSVMVKKKIKTDEDDSGLKGNEEDGKKSGKGKGDAKQNSLKISEMDEWIESGEESDSDSDEDGSSKKKDKKNDRKKGAKAKAKKPKKEVDSEAEEESDDGDEEGRELDYDSESSASEDELETKREEKGVDEEDAIRKVLDSDSDEENEEENKEEKEGEDEEKDSKDTGNEEQKNIPKPGGEPSSSSNTPKKKKKKKKESEKNAATSRESSADSSDISESEIDLESSVFFTGKKKGKGSNSASESNSRSGSPPAPVENGSRPEKRKAEDSAGQQTMKKLKSDAHDKPAPGVYLPAAAIQAANEAGITEEGVKRYLSRKPMTAKELLQKFKTKKTGIPSDQLVLIIAQILQRLNLDKKKIRDALYFSLKQ
ncbi:unnamed protein product [Notodromas monacha]|uniref:Transcription initiation factor IIF subunit alpha n=1 Tax=Notodromas monacha TaxID=399045 RepID=A0A7R9GEA0_9CRUS|nr:unnamed protein product [Notodromas monacha]CAG0917824.1 unnamed protein product [Notodromas monacha]